MKRLLWITLGAVVVAASLWTARTVWRAQHDLVSLRVRNAPVAAVLDQLERQSGETIVADTGLSGSVTLDLQSVPLAEALQAVAEQAGALPGVLHTVYRSEAELTTLKSALTAGHGPDSERWTNLAPNFQLGGRLPELDLAADDSTPPTSGAPIELKMSNTDALPADLRAAVAAAMNSAGSNRPGGMTIRVNGRDVKGTDLFAPATNAPGGVTIEQEAVTRIGPSGERAGRQSRVMALRLDGNQLKSGDLDRVLREQLGTNSEVVAEAVASAVAGALSGLTNGNLPGGTVRHFSTGPMVTLHHTSPGAGGESRAEIWAPERIILEASLQPRLGDELPSEPTRGEAEAVARQVRGRCVTLHTLKASPLGPVPAGFWKGIGPGAHPGVPGIKSGTNGLPDLDQIQGELEARMKRESLERFQKLTPEQRAERARAGATNALKR